MKELIRLGVGVNLKEKKIAQIEETGGAVTKLYPR